MIQCSVSVINCPVSLLCIFPVGSLHIYPVLCRVSVACIFHAVVNLRMYSLAPHRRLSDIPSRGFKAFGGNVQLCTMLMTD